MYLNKAEKEKDLERKLKTYLANGENNDLTLVARRAGKEDVRIPVNHAWLMVKSKGFCRLIHALDPLENDLVLDEKPSALKRLVKFINANKLNSVGTVEEIEELLDINRRIPTSGLLKDCISALKSLKLTAQNVIKIWRLAKEHGEGILVVSAETYMLRKARSVLSRKEFLTLNREELVWMLEKDELNCQELEIFKATLRLATHQYQLCNGKEKTPSTEDLRQIMIPFLKHIRFPIMTAEEFDEHVSPGILTLDERAKVLDFIRNPSEVQEVEGFITRLRVWRPPSPETEDIIKESIPVPRKISVYQQITLDFYNRNKEGAAGDDTTTARDNPNPNIQPASTSSNILANPEYHSTSTFPAFKKEEKDPLECWADLAKKLRDEVTHSSASIVDVSWGFATSDEHEKIEIRPSQLGKFRLNISYDDINDGKQMSQFEQTFDIRKYMFMNSRRFDDIWKLKFPVEIVINGRTFFRLNLVDPAQRELTMSFRNHHHAILEQIGGQSLKKLSLMKTDVPNYSHFPSKDIKDLQLYHVWASSAKDVGDFLKNCPSLETLCSWVICTWWENRNNMCQGKSSYNFSPTTIDLNKHLVSGSKLKHLALCKANLTFSGTVVKSGVRDLFLDTCYWPVTFADTIHKIFPYLQHVSIKMDKNEQQGVNPSTKGTISIRLVHNVLFKIPSILWVKLWKIDWEERYHNMEFNVVGKKQTRQSVPPISSSEVEDVMKLFTECGLSPDATNVVLERDPIRNKWWGFELNATESDIKDNGFWNEMDHLDYEYYKLGNFFKDYQTYQTTFDVNLGLP